jgi:hypothetical protein
VPRWSIIYGTGLQWQMKATKNLSCVRHTSLQVFVVGDYVQGHLHYSVKSGNRNGHSNIIFVHSDDVCGYYLLITLSISWPGLWSAALLTLSHVLRERFQN